MSILNMNNVMTDEKGNIVWEVVDKHPFGEFEVKGKTVNLLDYGGVESWSYTVDNPLRFPGQYNDYNYRSVIISGKKGPYYNYHRWYNPDIGRYMEVDPLHFHHMRYFFDKLSNISYNIANHVFVYAESNPVIFYDINALLSCDCSFIRCWIAAIPNVYWCFEFGCCYICDYCIPYVKPKGDIYILNFSQIQFTTSCSYFDTFVTHHHIVCSGEG